MIKLFQPVHLIISLTLALIIGLIDFQTSWEISMFPLYGIPVFITAWYSRASFSVLMAILATCVWWYANRHDNPYRTELGYAWAAVCRLSFYCSVAITGSLLRVNQAFLLHKLQAVNRISQMDRDLLHASENRFHFINTGLKEKLLTVKSQLDGIAIQTLDQNCLQVDVQQQVKNAVRVLDDLCHHLDLSLVETRDKSFNLELILNDLFQSLAKSKSVSIHKETLFRPEELNLEVTTQLFRIVHEAANAAIDLGKASKISMTLVQDRKHLVLTMTDDASVKWAESEKAWLVSQLLHHRTAILGAKLDLRDQPPVGTQLHLVVKI